MANRFVSTAATVALLVAASPAQAINLQTGPRREIAATNRFLGPPFHAPTVAVAGDGSHLVAWQDDWTGAVQLRAFDPAGEPRGESWTLGDAGNRGANQPQAVALPEGAFLVVWLEPLAAPSRLMGRAVDEAGSPLGPAEALDEVAARDYDERRYANPRGAMASRADVAAFPEQAANGASRELASLESAAQERLPVARALRADPRAGDEESARKARATGGALDDATATEPTAAFLAGGRFNATVDWRLRDGTSGTATAVPLSDDTALFWFFSPQNLEMAVKLLDGTGVNGHHWVFFASLTDVEFDLTVVDNLTGERRTYHNPAGTMASRADVEAFS